MEEKKINMIEPVENDKPMREKYMMFQCVDCGGWFPIKESKVEEWHEAHGTYPCHCSNCKKRRNTNKPANKTENN